METTNLPAQGNRYRCGCTQASPQTEFQGGYPVQTATLQRQTIGGKIIKKMKKANQKDKERYKEFKFSLKRIRIYCIHAEIEC